MLKLSHPLPNYIYNVKLRAKSQFSTSKSLSDSRIHTRSWGESLENVPKVDELAGSVERRIKSVWGSAACECSRRQIKCSANKRKARTHGQLSAPQHAAGIFSQRAILALCSERRRVLRHIMQPPEQPSSQHSILPLNLSLSLHRSYYYCVCKQQRIGMS